MQYNTEKIKNHLKRKLDAERYEHTIGVTYTAAALAMRYGCDLKKAELAGLLHDCAKCIPDNKKLIKCTKYNISITDIEKENPYLLHAKLGAFLTMNRYRIDDREIINAILYHTTGRPAMSTLEKIIYVADFIEPGRNKAGSLDEIRRTAFVDLDLTMYLILKSTLEYLNRKSDVLDPATVRAYEYYSALKEEKTNILKEKEKSI